MIITCIVMLVSVLLTHKITTYLGLNLKIKPLLFCALCALFINFTLPSISVYIAKFHLLVVFSIILCSAFLITQYNSKLSVSSIEADHLNMDRPVLIVFPETLSIPLKLLHTAPIEPSLVIAPAEQSHRKRTFKKIGKCLQIKKDIPSYALPSIILLTIKDIVSRDLENEKLLKLTAVLSKLASLDAILDYAYEQKTVHSYANAIFAFKQALERYRSDDYAPFIAIEIGNIYKNTGLYDEAIVIYNRAFLLSAVISRIELQKEFQNSISYLRIVKTILLKYNCFKMAFIQIPPSILQEIESEFVLWRTQKYAS